mgnify:CR=1 FL=1
MKKIIFLSLITMMTVVSCKKDDCPTPTTPAPSSPTRIDSLIGVWTKYRVEEYRQDTLYSGYNFTNGTCNLSLAANGQAVDEFTYCSSHNVNWTLSQNEIIHFDSTGTLPIVTWEVERLTADTLVLFQHHPFPQYRIKYYFAR